MRLWHRVFVVLLIVVFLVPLAVYGQGGDANSLESLEDYLRYAAINNAGLKAAFE